MKWLTAQYRPWVVYAGSTLTALAIFTSNLRGGFLAQQIEAGLILILSPVLSTVDTVTDVSEQLWNEYIDLRNLKQENLKLMDELREAKSDRDRLTESEITSERYKQLLNLSEQFGTNTIASEVIQRSGNTWNSILLVNSGSVHGVSPFMGVISEKGVVGQVVRVTPYISKVITLLHPQCGVAVLMQKSRISGVIAGNGQGSCTLKFASHFDRVILGDTVVTSGFDAVFEKGIPVGRVTRVEKVPGEIFQRIEIMPFVEFSSVESVLLMIQQNEMELPQ
jgi:rod shape-determining protein MreC